jgi:hypothetical protein
MLSEGAAESIRTHDVLPGEEGYMNGQLTSTEEYQSMCKGLASQSLCQHEQPPGVDQAMYQQTLLRALFV